MKRNKFLFLAILYFPGTVIHELSHFFAAKILGVRTGRISLTPRFTDTGIELGSVEIGNTNLISRFIIGIAPLLSGIFILLAVGYSIVFIEVNWWIYVLEGYLVLSVLNTMSLSKSDLQGSWKILLILTIALVILIALH